MMWLPLDGRGVYSTIVVAIDPTPATGGAGAGWRLMACVHPPAAERPAHPATTLVEHTQVGVRW